MTTAELQAWIAVIGGFIAAVLGILKYFNYRTKRDQMATVGLAFAATMEALGSDERAKQFAGAILLRRFFDPSTEQGTRRAPYKGEAVAVIAAILRGMERGELQKLLADGLAHAPTLEKADLQSCNLSNVFLGHRSGNKKINVSGADFFRADLSEASLRGVIGRKAVFYQATLRDTVFEDADLSDSNFRDADLEGARFDGANLAGAQFAGAKGVPAAVRHLLGDGDSVPRQGETFVRPAGST